MAETASPPPIRRSLRPAQVLTRLRAAPALVWALFLLAYVLFDNLGVMLRAEAATPWNLSCGVALVFLAWAGRPGLIGLFVAEIISSLISPAFGRSIPEVLACGVAALAGYGPVTGWMHRRRAAVLSRQRELIALLAAGFAAALAVAVFNVPILWSWSGLSADQFLSSAYHGWTANFLGVVIVVPAALALRAWRPKLTGAGLVEVALQAAALAACTVTLFGGLGPDRFRMFYLLFLPQIWIAARFGVQGAVLANLTILIAVFSALMLTTNDVATILSFQPRLLSLTISGLFLGVAVSQGRATEEALRQRQDDLARVSRLSIAGEISAGLAHELNQPLLAAIAFARSAQRLLDRPERAREALDQSVLQIERAGGIVRSLRRIIDKGERERTSSAPAQLAQSAVGLIQARCQRAGVVLTLAAERQAPNLLVDPIQIQQVILNLIQNSLDSILAGRDAAEGAIALSVRAPSRHEVEFEVRDTGPGISAAVAERLFFPFVSSKDSGMGLGLTVSQGIVEAHGGRIWIAEAHPGNVAFRFSLPAGAARRSAA